VIPALCMAAVISATGPTSAPATRPAIPDLDYTVAGRVAIQYHGQVMPLTDFARHVVGQVTGTERFEGQDPLGLVLSWTLEPIRWADYPLIQVSPSSLKAVLGLPADRSHFSPNRLVLAHQDADPRALEPLHEQGLQVLLALKARSDLADLTAWRLVPHPTNPHARWLTLREIWQLHEGSTTRIRRAFAGLLATGKAGHQELFEVACRQLASASRAVNPAGYPAQSQPAPGAAPEPVVPDLDYTATDQVAILWRGRHVPMDSFARQAVKAVTGRERLRGHEPVGLVLGWLTRPDAWSDYPLIQVNYQPLKKELGLPIQETRFAYNRLRHVLEQSDPQRLRKMWAHVHRVLKEMAAFEEVRDGRAWQVVPHPTDAKAAWTTPIQWGVEAPDRAAPISNAFMAIMRAYRGGDNPAFVRACGELSTAARAVHPVTYPSRGTLALECTYNRLRPFFWAMLMMLAAALAFALALWSGSTGLTAGTKRWLWAAGVAMLVSGVGVQAAGLVVRTILAGRAPMANMYESLIFMAAGVGLAAVVFEWVYRKRVFGLVAALLNGVGLLLADVLPLSATIEPLMAALRDTMWLSIHVTTIMLSYSAFAVAMGLGHVLLGFCALAPWRTPIRRHLADLTWWVVDIGLVLLAAGITTGAIWGNEAWGRYWGWDPKESWSLVTMFGYLAMVHAVRFSGRHRDLVTGAGAVLGFLLVVMTYYGVNYVLRSGLHVYGGSGGGGALILLIVVAVESLVVAGGVALALCAPRTAETVVD